MKIFKLMPEPNRLNEIHWRASTYQGELIVRAEDEASARMIPAMAFGIGVERTSVDQEIACLPWSRAIGLVDCSELTSSEFSIEGEEEILSPAKYNQKYQDLIAITI
jgi:hypothetical protein